MVTNPYSFFQSVKAAYQAAWPDDFEDRWYWGTTNLATHTAKQRVVAHTLSDIDLEEVPNYSGALVPVKGQEHNILLWQGFMLALVVFAPLGQLFPTDESMGLISKLYSISYKLLIGPRNEGLSEAELSETDYGYGPDPLYAYTWYLKIWVPVYKVGVDQQIESVEIGGVDLNREEG